MRRSYRQGRLSEEIKRIISQMLYGGLKDPRFSGLISVSDVKASNDGSHATVYITVVGSEKEDSASEKEKKDVLDAFNSAKGLIRKEIGTQLKLRHTPDLVFKIDTSQEYGRHIEKIISELNIKDEE